MTDRSKLERFLWGAGWAALGGLQPALLDMAHDWYAYKPPLDWQHIGFMTAGGVIMGLAGYWQQQKALFTPVPVMNTGPETSGAPIANAAVAVMDRPA